MSDTIAAIATPGQPSAIGILRLSGPDTCAALDAVFRAKNGRPAASMSMAMAKQPELRASAIFRATVALSHGLTVGMPAPPQAVMAAAAPSMTLWSVPSPVKAAMPAAAQAGTRILL